MDNVPGGIYLCQVSETVSCGACCGVYNVSDNSRDSLLNRLQERTEAFLAVPREMDAILSFGEAAESRETWKKPFQEFHHCPYIGLIGSKRSRVGCLLHPLSSGNKGIDYRGLSFYGGMACRMYFCPSCHFLSPVIKAMVHEVSEDWYLYGLVITEKKMLEAFFQSVEVQVGRTLTVCDLTKNSRCLEILQAFLALKIKWPFRPRPHPGPCNYFFKDQRYIKPPVNYDTAGRHPSRYDILFRELISRFDSNESLERAETLIDTLIEQFASSVSS